MAATNLTKSTDIQVKAREINFVTKFARDWEHFRNIMGVMRPIQKAPGTLLKSLSATVTLESGTVAEGDVIPYSQSTVVETPYAEITLDKYAKGVSIEAINKHGYDVAIAETDKAFRYELLNMVTGRFYDYLNTGTLTSSEATWQKALAMAKGRVLNKFKLMHRAVTGVVGFVNILDLYDYLGNTPITVQTAFGFQYVKDFMGYDTVFLLSEAEIPQGRVIATPVDNIVLYYVNPSDGNFGKAGLNFTTDSMTNLIGYHVEGKYGTMESVSYAIVGLTLFAEYIDGIAVIDVDTTPTLGTLTVTSVAGTESGDTTITVSPAKESASNVYKYKIGDSAVSVAYNQNVMNWTAWDGTSDITAATGKIITVVEADGSYKAQNSGSATVTAKS